MAIRESGENYLETILILGEGKKDVHSVDVARRLGVSKPTVTKGIKLLVQEGYVVMDGMHLCLTESGEKRARAVYEKHLIITEFWVRRGVPREAAERDACRMEHIVGDEVFAVMKESVLAARAAGADGEKEGGERM